MTYDEASWCVGVFSTVKREEPRLAQGQPHLQGSYLRSFVPLSLQTGSGTDKGPWHGTSKCKIEDVSWIRNCFKSSWLSLVSCGSHPPLRQWRGWSTPHCVSSASSSWSAAWFSSSTAVWREQERRCCTPSSWFTPSCSPSTPGTDWAITFILHPAYFFFKYSHNLDFFPALPIFL